MATLIFCGAVEGVTGSAYLLSIGTARVLLDCGLFQGRKEEEEYSEDDEEYNDEL